jgi:hypothetical protein
MLINVGLLNEIKFKQIRGSEKAPKTPSQLCSSGKSTRDVTCNVPGIMDCLEDSVSNEKRQDIESFLKICVLLQKAGYGSKEMVADQFVQIQVAVLGFQHKQYVIKFCNGDINAINAAVTLHTHKMTTHLWQHLIWCKRIGVSLVDISAEMPESEFSNLNESTTNGHRVDTMKKFVKDSSNFAEKYVRERSGKHNTIHTQNANETIKFQRIELPITEASTAFIKRIAKKEYGFVEGTHWIMNIDKSCYEFPAPQQEY